MMLTSAGKNESAGSWSCMSFLTIFTAPKPFINPHISIIQRNAINSWLNSGEDIDIFLIGDEKGIAETALELEVKHLPNVQCNSSGTPLVSSIFELAHLHNQAPLMSYINADILILPDFIHACREIKAQLSKFLVVGQRWDLDIIQDLDFSTYWVQILRNLVEEQGKLHPPAGSDYFIFPELLFKTTPDFAIGRAGWDNWMIYHARQNGWKVIDATPSVNVIHQNHDYSHLPGGKPHYFQDESYENETIAGGQANLFMVLDSEKQLRNGRLSNPKFSVIRILRRAEVALTPQNGNRQKVSMVLARRFRRLRRRVTGTL